MINLKRSIIAVIGLCFLLCSPKASDSAPVPKRINPALYYLLFSSPTILPPLPLNWIAGNLTANNNTNQGDFIAGYSVKVQLKDQSNSVIDSQIVTLNANGQGSYMFSPALGTYLVTVVQAAGKICLSPPASTPALTAPRPHGTQSPCRREAHQRTMWTLLWNGPSRSAAVFAGRNRCDTYTQTCQCRPYPMMPDVNQGTGAI